MARWKDVETQEPEFASAVRTRFDAHKHKIMATVRKDGSPRISGSEVTFADGDVWFGSMPGARKLADLRRDPRLALHCMSDDPPEDPTTWSGDAGGSGSWFYDPDDSFAGQAQVLPFGRGAQAVMEPALEAGAIGFVGVLTDYPSDSYRYYVPYDGISRPIPGVWISGSSGTRLRELLAHGAVRATIVVDSVRRSETSFNIVGELPGADEEVVIVGSHHDGPWASAVEDGSGIALVLAQAAYWSRIPKDERPHRLLFLLNAGHMAGGAGVHQFIAAHQAELDRVVLEVHLEHAANECVEENGSLQPTGQPEARWWFTSRIPPLESSVRAILETEDLRRSFILPPDVFAPYPTTDGGPFQAAGVPLVNYLTAPFYLFDEQDTMDKIHRPSLVPVTRAAIRPIEWTAGWTASELRATIGVSSP